jgi:tRNA threonylcarbamoyladenosine biosynthesis protein TsaB
MEKYGLAIDSSTGQLGLGLLDPGGSIKIQTWDLDRSMSSHLHQCLKEFLQGINWQQLAFIAVVKGPGSFTSIRIGMVTARILAQQLSIPLLSLSSLASLAQTQAKSTQHELIATQLTATRDKYYVAIYEKSPTNKIVSPFLADMIVEMQQWKNILNQIEKPYYLVEGGLQQGYAVEGLLQLANNLYLENNFTQWSQALPLYLS